MITSGRYAPISTFVKISSRHRLQVTLVDTTTVESLKDVPFVG